MQVFNHCTHNLCLTRVGRPQFGDGVKIVLLAIGISLRARCQAISETHADNGPTLVTGMMQAGFDRERLVDSVEVSDPEVNDAGPQPAAVIAWYSHIRSEGPQGFLVELGHCKSFPTLEVPSPETGESSAHELRRLNLRACSSSPCSRRRFRE